MSGNIIFQYDLKTYDHIRKIATGQGDDYTTGHLLDYPCFKNYYNLIGIDLSKQQKLDADPKAIEQSIFTGSLDRVVGSAMLFIIDKAKETVPDFSKGAVKVLSLYFNIILIQKWLNITYLNINYLIHNLIS